ncbi:Carboxysome shell peptide mid-region [Ectothiorhodospira magna]|uniref:Carboxysome shell peptide mid-region n=1 Tax=Ectothiorhodospira magna TaxID=867345 RepID=A0A1H9ERH6_9GAMM|nr:CsoS2 family carboxysome shell protein [Ectothiorhodospira magna]SEQ28269.1 Carboxysome shell peptide mid-region [Ectothiorhodospira magna]
MANRPSSSSSGRQAALARRQALASRGKGSTSAVPPPAAPRPAPAPTVNRPAPAARRSMPTVTPPARGRATAPRAVMPEASGRAQAQARRAALSRAGKRANTSSDRVRQAAVVAASEPAPPSAPSGCQCGGQCGRHSESSSSPQQPERAVTRSHSLSRRGNDRPGTGQDRRRNTLRRNTPNTQPAGRLQSQARRSALASRGKSAASTPTSAASLARQANPRLSGRELARSVRAQRSQNGAMGTRRTPPTGRTRPEPAQDQPWKVGVSETAAGQAVTGTLVGRSQGVTGNDSGTCRAVTGTEYLGAEIFHEFCQTTPPSRPEKVHVTRTGQGSRVTGNELGRGARVTGNEPGTCRRVTGNEYVGQEQYQQFCDTPPPGPTQPPKVTQATTARGQTVSGNMPGRSRKVTGDEPGTCQAVTGTPYTSPEQIADYCPPEAQARIEQRTSLAAQPGQPDFPQPLDTAPGQGFTVTSPARQVERERRNNVGVTGTRYDQQGGRITGPFDMATDKITGTDQARLQRPPVVLEDLDTGLPEGAPVDFDPQPETPRRARITGEGQSSGSKITGDDWERGDRVTGTEGSSARRRNPTRPGLMGAMPAVTHKRNQDVPPPVSRVTGSSGNTEKGSLVTYSGGARG